MRKLIFVYFSEELQVINYIKDKYYWHKSHQKLKQFLSTQEDQKILLFGYPKSGNTWLRFLIYNYLSLLQDPELSATISYNELNQLQNNVLDRTTVFLPNSAYPLFYRTHKIYNKSYDLFDKKVFIHRNPLDTLISAYHFYKNRAIPFQDDKEQLRAQLMDIDFYVKYKAENWISFFNISIQHADSVVNYSDLKKDPQNELEKLVQFLGFDHKKECLKKSVELSSFNSIKNMGITTNQQHGNGPKDGSFKGEFTRSGEEGQFNLELQRTTIEWMVKQFPMFTTLYPNIIR